jgi:hypothetical protein
VTDLKDYSNSLEETLKDSNIQNISVGLAEVVLDTLIDDGIAKDIPIIGTVVGLGKAVLGIKERLFLKKIIYFLSELSSIPANKRKQMIDKINSSAKFRVCVGEKLLFIIDRCEDHEKAQFIARMFAAFICQKISYEDFLRSASIIDRIMLKDLIWFVAQKDDWFVYEELDDLINTGLFNIKVVDQREYDLKLPTEYKLEAHLSEIGSRIRDILKTY